MENRQGRGTGTSISDEVFTRKEYIEREAAKRIVDDIDTWSSGWRDYAKLQMDSLSAADVVPVRHGRWAWNPDGMDWGLGAWCCSECESKAETWWANDRKYNPRHCSGGHFCGNCGARMDKDGDGE